MSMIFIELNSRLMTYNLFLRTKFEDVKQHGGEPDFFHEVKPFSDEVNNCCDAWLEEGKNWLELKRPKHITLNQLITTHDHLRQIAVQAFYPGTSKKKFLDSHKTIEYVLKQISLV